jgi:copper chaperone NosL
MLRAAGLVLLSGLPALLLGCGREATLEPPTVHYGQAVCDVCGMIVSDERFAAAEVVIRDGRAQTRYFDDTGEVFDLEAPAGAEHAWYVHDMRTLEWLDAREAVYLRSEQLHTPMGLHIAAFGTAAGAERARAEFGGEVLSFEQLGQGPP